MQAASCSSYYIWVTNNPQTKLHEQSMFTDSVGLEVGRAQQGWLFSAP